MRPSLLCLLVIGLLLTACSRLGPAATPTPSAVAPVATPTSADATATPVPKATTVPPTLPAATPTSLAEGLTTRLGTPNPNPNCPDHYPWFFENTADECASFVLFTWTVWERFEHGLMVWTQEAGRTYVLLDDGSPFKPYVIVSDPFGMPLPEPDPAITPPEGMYQPERGFALFWRNLVPGHEWVREKLGWATAPEAAYSGFHQCNLAVDATARCYLNGPGDEIIVIATNVGWWAYVQPTMRDNP